MWKIKGSESIYQYGYSLSDEEILDFYTRRWYIEVFFRTVKNRFAFAKCQIRSARAVQRVWILRTSLFSRLFCIRQISLFIRTRHYST
ncbi:MAG: transposase [Ruminococcus sp.]|nr:transposase [Ruminococcus sp.]